MYSNVAVVWVTLWAEPDHLPRLEDLHFDDVFQVLFYLEEKKKAIISAAAEFSTHLQEVSPSALGSSG